MFKDTNFFESFLFRIHPALLSYVFSNGMFSALNDPNFSYRPSQDGDIKLQIVGLSIGLLFPLLWFIVNPTLRQQLISLYFSSGLTSFLHLTAWGVLSCATGIRCLLALSLLSPLPSDILVLIETAIFVIQWATIGISVVLLGLYSSYMLFKYLMP